MALNPIPATEEALRRELDETKKKLADAEKSAVRGWERVKELESRMRTIREVTR